MNEYSEQILEAIDIIAQEHLSQLAFDKTIQAKIYSIVNLDTGEYKVRYNSNIFSAFSDDPEKVYKVDDDVYVSVPEGNFSNRKLIVSTVSAQSLSYAQLTQLQNTFVSVSPSLTELYQDVKQEPYKVIAGADPSGELGVDWIYQGADEYSPSDFHGLFQQYMAKYNLLRVSCSFLTQFHCLHDQGNYGIELEFYTTNGQTASYKLDINSFNGAPYSFSVYSPQFAVIQLPQNFLLGLKSIKFFQEGFIPDHFIENGIVTDKENLTVVNIFANSLSIDFVEKQDLSERTYHLTIATPQGTAFSETVSSLDLVGRLTYQGSDITNAKSCIFHWYERDLSVVIGSRNYDKLAGFGWKPLDNKTDRLSLTIDDVNCRQKYKLIVVYNKNTTVSAEVEITNGLSSYTPGLAQFSENEITYLRITDESLIGDWYVSFPDGTYMPVDGGENVNQIPINLYLTYSTVTFYCTVKTPEGDYLASLDYVIMNSASEEDVVVSYIGDDVYNYDANGDISSDIFEADHPLQVTLAWKEGLAASYTIDWLFRDEYNREFEIPRNRNQALEPENSMLDNLWVDNQNILHYNINRKYKVNYNNNTLVLRVRTIFGDSYFFEKEILFLKDGDQGTNGTTYVAVVRPCTEDGVKLSGLHPLIYQNGWQNMLFVRCYVYKDGELINGRSDYKINYKWTGNHLTIGGQGEDIAILAGQDDGLNNFEFYVKAQITIVDSVDEAQTDIYASYPVDVAMDGVNYELMDLDDIPSYIKYSASGVTPQFYNRTLEFRYNGESHNELITSLNEKALKIKENFRGELYLSPASMFLFDNTNGSNIGVLELREPASNARRLIHPIIMYLDNYGNEAINGWDGTQLDLDEEGGGHYVFAPQVGAGKKDSANRFTGVVMGTDSAQEQVGLYGYQNGVTTFGLMEDGTAFFGASEAGGRITLDGRTAKIYGGNGGDSEVGMTITLADLDPDHETDAIKLGAGVFRVTYDGAIYATAADIQGKIYAQEGQIGCDERKRGGWYITSNQLYSGTSGNYVGLSSNSDTDFAIWAGASSPGTAYTKTNTNGSIIGSISNSAPFVVTRDGFLYCKNARIKGNIEATEGLIGGWHIGSTSLWSNYGQRNVGMSSQGNASFWAGENVSESSTGAPSTGSYYFLVTRRGQLFCNSASIEGDITATTLTCNSGTIGGWEISYSGFKNGNNYIYTNGSIRMGNNFEVKSTGDVHVAALHVHSAYIDNDELGQIGFVAGRHEGSVTYNFGIKTTDSDQYSIVLESGKNIRLTASDHLWLDGDALTVRVDAAKQYGIYARFG